MSAALWMVVAGAALPVLGAVGVALRRRADRALVVGAAGLGALSTTLGAALSERGEVAQAVVDGELLFALDPIAATLAPALGLVAVAAALALPERALTLRGAGAALLMQGLSTALLAVADLRLLLLFELLKLVAVVWALRGGRAGRLAAVTLGLSGLLLVALSALLLGRAGWSAPMAAHVAALAEHPTWLLALSLAGLLRLGVFPFHGWLVAAFEEGHPAQILPLAIPASALVIIVRLVSPALEIALPGAHGVVVVCALLAALLSQGLALVQVDLGRALGFSVTAGLAALLVGAIDVDPIGRAGGVAHWAAWVLAIGGFVLAAGAAMARLGRVDLRRSHALNERAPRLGGLFVMLGFATAAGPGTVDFVSADLMLHGTVGHHWPQLLLLIAVMGVQGMNVLRWYFQIFTGPAPIFADPRAEMPLRLRERVGLMVVLAVLLIGGLAPNALPVIEHAAAAPAPGDLAHRP